MSNPVDALFRAYHKDVAAFCRRRLGDPEDAEDITIEVFSVAIRRVDDVPAGDEARLWLFGVARRLVANQVRAGRRRERLGARLSFERRSPVATDPAAPAISDPRVERAFAALSASDRELLALVAWEGLTPSEIARVIGRPAPVVSSRLARARRRFAHHYGRPIHTTTLVRQGNHEPA